MNKLLLILTVLFFFTDRKDLTAAKVAERLEWLNEIIPLDYDSTLSPRFFLNKSSEPFRVNFLFCTWGITEINLARMEFELDLGAGVYWEDERLNLSGKPNLSQQIFELPANIVTNLWTPAVFFANQKQTGKTFIVGVGGSQELRLQAWNKQILFWQRQLVRFRCYYRLQKYPFDSHRCTIIIRSADRDGRDFHKIHLNYIPATAWGDFPTMVKNRMPPEYEFIKIENETSCGDDLTGIAETCVSIHFDFRRITSHHIMLTFIPSILIVILSWFSFWLDVDCTAPRISLGLTSMLTLATQFGNAQKNLPAVAYVKAIDIWMITCVFMVFSTLVEYSIAYRLTKTSKIDFGLFKSQIVKIFRPSDGGVDPEPIFIRSKGEVQVEPVNNCRVTQQLPVMKKETPALKTPPKKTSRVDKWSRILFPLFFSFFNMFFWSIYST